MKKYIAISWLLAIVVMVSCTKWLEENPQTFLTPKLYFKTEGQVKAAVNGLYTFVDDIFDGDIEVGSATYIFIDYMTGYSTRPRAATTTDLSQAFNLSVAENNGRVAKLWQTAYVAIENCNSVKEGIESMASGVVSDEKKNKLLGEVYFLRAHNYFNLVTLFGPVPLKLQSTADSKNTAIALSSIEDVYAQIEADLLKADELMAATPWTLTDGTVSKGTVKGMLAKVYLTMAGYPLQKGASYYQKAYTEAQAVYKSGSFYLFDNYADLRSSDNENVGEYMWMIQREKQYAGSGVHFAMLPYPEPAKAISSNPSSGGALAPTKPFFDSYPANDLRTAEKGYYYTEHEAMDGSGVVALGKPYIYKYWDAKAASDGQSGANYPLLRYADVLLMMAEAKANLDNGTTSDIDAVSGYYLVKHRADPTFIKPAQITTNEILKERFWELCFENQTWYDMLRTRKILSTSSKEIVNLIGHEAVGHSEGQKFKESDLLFPYPLRERRLNPNLVRP